MNPIATPALPAADGARSSRTSEDAIEVAGDDAGAGGFVAVLAQRMTNGNAADTAQIQLQAEVPVVEAGAAAVPAGAEASLLIGMMLGRAMPAPDNAAAATVGEISSDWAGQSTSAAGAQTGATLLPVELPAAAAKPVSPGALLTASLPQGKPSDVMAAAGDPRAALPQADIALAASLAAGSDKAARVAADELPLPADAAAAAPEGQDFAHALHTQRTMREQPLPALRLETPVNAARWGEDVAQSVVWLTHNKESRAELVLTPPQMGKVEVSLGVTASGETSVHMVAANAQVRDALEQSLSRLREAFAAAGISLGQTSVSGDAPARDQGREQRGGGRGARDTLPVSAATSLPASALARRGLVDTFA